MWLLKFSIDDVDGAAVSAFIPLNRKLDWEAGSQHCGLFGGTPRQFSAAIPSASACAELYAGGYLNDPGAPCVLSGTEKPRIRIVNDLYGKRATGTPVAFLTKWYDPSRTSYEVRTETDATVISAGLDSSTRIVVYAGLARLWRFDPGAKLKPVADAFPLPFQMTFRRTAQ